jgi:signal transduction histidine kinase
MELDPRSPTPRAGVSLEHLTPSKSLAVLLHEMRQPVQAAVWALELARRSDEPPARDRALEVIRRQLDGITRLLNDLTALQRDGRLLPDVTLAMIDLCRLVEGVVESESVELTPRRQRVTVQLPGMPVYVRGDGCRLTQVVTNLIANASRYTRPEGSIRVTLEHAGTDAVLTVADNGRGIAPDRASSLFDLFTDQDEPGRSGSGIGLAVVRTFVEAHGGRVEVRSAGDSRGSEFVVRLPAVGESTMKSPAVSDT